MDSHLRKVLTQIDTYYSRRYHMRMLRFFAQAIIPYEQLQDCENVLKVYEKLASSRKLRGSDSSTAVALLRYMICVTGYNRVNELKQLDRYCAEEFDLASRFPSLPFYERLLVISSKLRKSRRFGQFLSSLDEDKLNKSKIDVSTSPIDVFQSMIYKRTLDPDRPDTLQEEVVPLLKKCDMTDEVQLLQLGSFVTLSSIDEPVNSRMYFTFAGKPPVHDSHCMRPLWTSKEELRSSCSLSSEQKCFYTKVFFSLTAALMVTSVTLFNFAIPRFSEYTQTQPFYAPGSLTYSPFPNTSFDPFFFNKINVTALVADDNDFEKFNLTVCSTSCPLETTSETLPTVASICSNDRVITNCYVNLRRFRHPDQSIDPQYFTLYMQQGSVLTFLITKLVPQTDVQLCITASVDVCYKVFKNSTGLAIHRICQEVLTFNKTNNQSQSFIARTSSYYCAVWVLEDNNQSLNYTVNETLVSYVIRSKGELTKCQTHQKQVKTQIFDLPQHDKVCVAIQVTGYHLYNNMTLVSTVVSSKSTEDNIFKSS